MELKHVLVFCLAAAILGGCATMPAGPSVMVLPDPGKSFEEFKSDDAVCRAARESGVRFLLARGWADVDYPEQFIESGDQIVAEMERLMQTWHGTCDERIRVGFGPVIPWGCSNETMRRTYTLAQEWGVATQIHTAETQAEEPLRAFCHR